MVSKAIFPFESFGFLLLFSYFNTAINANNILSHKELNFNKFLRLKYLIKIVLWYLMKNFYINIIIKKSFRKNFFKVINCISVLFIFSNSSSSSSALSWSSFFSDISFRKIELSCRLFFIFLVENDKNNDFLVIL